AVGGEELTLLVCGDPGVVLESMEDGGLFQATITLGIFETGVSFLVLMARVITSLALTILSSGLNRGHVAHRNNILMRLE
ncbi:hypothetical protein HAX54_005790, partial [Datura stramonium]|nr:hypothetical protein [Datura stramonium]